MSSGIASSLGSCVVAFFDHNRDGWQDILVGNCNDVKLDPTPFELFINQGNNTFLNKAEEAGIAKPGFWMGIAFGDVNNDGKLDFFSTNFSDKGGEKNDHVLFQRQEDGTYKDVASDLKVAISEFGWGATLTDFDNNGCVDLMKVGALPMFGRIGPGLADPGRLYFNDCEGNMLERTENTGVDLSSSFTSGLASADFDNDGFMDVVVVTETQANPVTREVVALGHPVLLRNKGNNNKSLSVKLEATRVLEKDETFDISKPRTNKDAIGAEIYVYAQGRKPMLRLMNAGSSYGSYESPWPHFGLGQADSADIVVRWPAGHKELFTNVKAGDISVLKEDRGLSCGLNQTVDQCRTLEISVSSGVSLTVGQTVFFTTILALAASVL